MIFNRPWIALLFAGFCCALENASAQDSELPSGPLGPSPAPSVPAPSVPAPTAGGNASGGAGGFGGTGATGATGGTSGAGANGGTGAQGGNPAGTGGTDGSGSEGAAKPGAASSFGDAGLGATGGGSSVTGSQASTQGVGFGTPKIPTSEAPTFTLPGFYGSSATTFTAGQGRLARPRFRYTTSLSMGFDDNVFQTPTKSVGTEAITVPVEVEPAQPPQVVQEQRVKYLPKEIGPGGIIIPPRRVPYLVNVTVPGTPAKFKDEVVVPAQPAAKRVSSALTQASASADIQIYTARSLFTFDLNGSASQYWNRPGSKSTDFNGSSVFSFLYRFTPRLQFTTQFNGAYLSQPDLSRINTPQQQTGSDYLTANFKNDLTYRWNRRLTSVFSLTDNVFMYQDKALEAGDYNETVFGTELRYLWSARFTFLGEVRYNQIRYQGDEARDSNTVFALIGAEARVSNRLSGTLRLGASMRTFVLSDDPSTTPYLEGSFAYRSGPTTVWNLNTRFGFEEASAAGQERRVLRSGLSFSKTFSPRLNGLLSSNFIVENTTAGETSFSSQSYDANARLEYKLTKAVSVNTNVSYTKANSGTSASDYYRIRCFFGLEYTF